MRGGVSPASQSFQVIYNRFSLTSKASFTSLTKLSTHLSCRSPQAPVFLAWTLDCLYFQVVQGFAPVSNGGISHPQVQPLVIPELEELLLELEVEELVLELVEELVELLDSLELVEELVLEDVELDVELSELLVLEDVELEVEELDSLLEVLEDVEELVELDDSLELVELDVEELVEELELDSE